MGFTFQAAVKSALPDLGVDCSMPGEGSVTITTLKESILSHSVTITALNTLFTPLISHYMTTTAGGGLSSNIFL